MAADGAGTVWLAYNLVRADPDESELATTPASTVDLRMETRVIRSDDRGASWSLPATVLPAQRNVVLRWSESRDRGLTWTAPSLVHGEGTSFAARPGIAADGRASVAWYGADVAGEPEEAPEGTAWHVFLATRWPGQAAWAVQRLTAEPVKAGPMCSKGTACSELGHYDWLGLGHLPDGRVAVAYQVGPDAAGDRKVHAAVMLPGGGLAR